MPTTIRYDGPLDAVEVPLPSGVVVVVPRGQTGRFTDDLAARLLEQDCWNDPNTPTPPVDEPTSGDAEPDPQPGDAGSDTTDTSGDAPQED